MRRTTGAENPILRFPTARPYTSGILATEFDDVYTFELSIGESSTAAQTLAYSVNTYAYRMQDHSIDSMASLARALYTYGKSAEAFIAV